jgi:hypothetical protein
MFDEVDHGFTHRTPASMPEQQPHPVAQQQNSHRQKDVPSPASRNAGRRAASRSKPSSPDEEQAKKEGDPRIVENCY